MPTPLTFEWDEAAWRIATEMLTPEARGIYREILGHLYLQTDRSGVITGTREEIARAGRCSAVQADLTLQELAKYRVAEVTERNGVVTLINRRMRKRHKTRENANLRVKKHRDNTAERPLKRSGNARCNAAVTPSPRTPFSKSDKGNDKALSPLSAYKERGTGKTSARGKNGASDGGASVPASRNSKLTEAQRELTQRFEIVLGHQWPNDAGKWINRIKDPKTIAKAERVLAEVESATKENRIDTTPAQYAEQIWKEFV